MFKYLIAFALLSPLIGVYWVEQGAYAMSVGKDGYPNGAFQMFAIYVLIVFSSALLFSSLFRKFEFSEFKMVKNLDSCAIENRTYNQFSSKLFILHIILIIVMLFLFGGINVWLGAMDKGEFRVKLGSFGSIAFILTKYASPTMFAYLTILYINSSKNNFQKLMWGVNMLLIFILGSTWGFKSTGISMILPSLLILFWQVSFRKIIKLCVYLFSILIGFFFLFDSATNLGDGTSLSAIQFIFERLTVLQGDVSWYIWGNYQAGEKFPSYWPTLFSAFGDSNLKLFGVDRGNLNEWMSYHYDWMLSYVSGLPLETIDNGHSIVGTPFSEGLVAGGVAGIVIIAIIAGLVISISYYLMNRFRSKKQYIYLTLFASYFYFNIFTWLIGGGITQLFHISNFIGFFITIVLIKLLKQNIKMNFTSEKPNFK